MSDKPPNILFLFPDQHRADWLGGSADLPLRTRKKPNHEI
jgi:hypothetical protein